MNLYFGLSWALAIVLVIGIWASLGGFAAVVSAVVIWLGLRGQSLRAYRRAKASAPDRKRI